MRTFITALALVASFATTQTAAAQTPDLVAMKATCQTAAAQPVSLRAETIRDLARTEANAFAKDTKKKELDVSNVLVGDVSQPAWKRVLDYYSITRLRGSLYVSHSADGATKSYYETQLRPKVDAAITNPTDRAVIGDALTRAALYDTPWSAAFVSTIMKTAGFAADQWEASAGHHGYIRAAILKGHESGSTYAYAGCDPAWVRPRVGDLICYSRGSGSPKTFETAVSRATAGQSYTSHCDIVTSSDPASTTLQSIGGNVSDSVTKTDRVLGPGPSATASTLKKDAPWIAVLVLVRP